jgi:hypothetical protein
MLLIVGESYTRDQIHDVLGGETQSNLPQKDGRIVCELAVVCAICHAMIHVGGECRPIDSLICK